MALEYVGSASNTGANGTYTVSLTALSGGSDTEAIEGDLVISATTYFNNDNTWKTTAVTTSGFNKIADVPSDDSNDTALIAYYKVMTSTPDTTVGIEASGASGTGSVTCVHVWRNVNTTTPLDVTSTTGSGTNTSYANGPSITPVTSGAVVLTVGGCCGSASNQMIGAAPSGYGNTIKIDHSNSSEVGATGIASKAWTSGPEDPSGWGFSGSDSTGNSWSAITIAIRPAGQSFDLTETLSLSETSTSLRARNFTSTDTLSLTETISALKGLVFSISETLNLTEVFTTTRTFVVNVIDTLGLSEIVSVRKKWEDLTKNSSTFTSTNKSSASTFTEPTKSSSTWEELNKS